MYDVVKVVRSKTAIKGSLKVEAIKGDSKFFSFVNQFEKNMKYPKILLNSGYQ